MEKKVDVIKPQTGMLKLEDLISNINNSNSVQIVRDKTETLEASTGGDSDGILEIKNTTDEVQPCEYSADERKVDVVKPQTGMQKLEDLISNINNSNSVQIVRDKTGTLEASTSGDSDGILEIKNTTDEVQLCEYSADELSINVSVTEIDMLNDNGDDRIVDTGGDELDEVERDEEGDEEAGREVERDEEGDEEVGREVERDEEADEEADKGSSITNSVTSIDHSEEKEVLFEQKSKLHCRLCGDFYKNPKILNCLHNFCLECLEKRKHKDHKFLFCPVCNFKTNINKNVDLKTNTVMTKLITRQRSETNTGCVVCKMHSEEKASSHVCKDCGDLLCKDCAVNHTFSRFTAKHNVVESDKSTDRYGKHFGHCDKHSCEELKYMCQDCSTAVCRDCVMLSHQNHHCMSQQDLHSQISQGIQKQMDSLKSKVQKFQESIDNEHEEDLNFLQEEEKKHEVFLQKVAADIVATINKKLEKGLSDLHAEYQKKRNYCKSRKGYIEESGLQVCGTLADIDFLLKEGTGSDLFPLQEKINHKLKNLEKRVENTFVRVKDLKQLPEVKTVTEHIALVENLAFFRVKTHEKQKDNGGAKQTKKEVSSKLETIKLPVTEKRARKSENIKSTSGNNNLLTPKPKPSLGRGQMQPTSLLGAYPGSYPLGQQHDHQVYNRHDRSPLLNIPSQPHSYGEHTIKGFNEQHTRFVEERSNLGTFPLKSPSPKENNHDMINVTFQSSFNTTITSDKLESRAKGLAFVEKMNFVVSDTANNQLKVFSLKGTFLDMIHDIGPLSVTSCSNAIIWNAHFNKIQVSNRVYCISLWLTLSHTTDIRPFQTERVGIRQF